MTARVVRAVVSVAVLVTAAACTHFYEIPIETPIRPKLDTTGFQRVLVAGFISGGSEEIDANVETTRLLRSQLRSKSDLRVIDADTLPLVEVASKRDTGGNGAPEGPPAIREDKDLEFYEPVFADVGYWKQIGEEFQQPLIVTGTVMFTPHESTRAVVRPEETYDQFGRRQVETRRVFVERRGFELRPKFIFIDGRTGTVMHSESLREAIVYSANQQTPALSSYFELMDKVIPSFLGTLSSQRVKGTRYLLR
jgi:hypothetical protein